MAVSNMAGSQTPARCYRLPAAGPARFRPRLLLPSPAPTCHRLSAAAAPWALSLASVGASVALRTAPRAHLVGMAVSSGADPGPPSDHSHGGGRGRGRQAGSGQQAPRGQSGGRGKQDQEQERGGGSSAGQSGIAPPPPRRSADGRVPSGASGHGRGAYGKADPKSSGKGSSGSGGGVFVRLSDLQHLGQLQEVVEQQVQQWAAKKDHTSLVAALERTCKLPPDPSFGQPEDAARRALLHTLAGVFLPLVPSITRPDYCTRPLWACAKTGYGWAGGATEVALAEVLLGRLGEGGCALLRRAKPQEHASLWWSLSEAPNAGLVAAQGQLLAASAECLVGISARDMGAQECANVLLACARLQYSPTHVPLVHHLTRCLTELQEPSAQALANALYALGELHEDCGHVPHQEDLRQLVGAVVRGTRAGKAAGVFTEQAVSNMLLGCAKLGVEDGEAVQLLAAAAGAAAGRMTGQGLANSVWALGKLLMASDSDGGMAPPSRGAGGDGTAAIAVTQLLSEVLRRLGPSMPGATPNDGTAGHAVNSLDLSSLLYGMALLQPHMDAVTPVQGGMSGSPEGPAVATFPAVVSALAGECVRRSFRGFEPQHLANATWALAKMSHADQGWFAAAVAAAQRPEFTSTALPKHWAQMWYALALGRHHPPPELLKCTTVALEGQVRREAPQLCASLLWSFAVLGVREERLAGVLLGRLAELVERQQQGQQGQGRTSASGRGGGLETHASMVVVEQALTNSLWAVAVAGPGALAAHAPEVGVLLREAARRWEQGGGGSRTKSFSVEALVQLWQVQLELEAMEGGEGGMAASLSHILPGARCVGGVGSGATTAPGGGSLRAAMEHAAREQGEVRGGASASASQLQRDVVAALRRLQRRQQEQQQQVHAPPVPASEPQCHAEGVAAPSDTHTTSEGYSGNAHRLVIIQVQHEAPVPALGSRVDVLVRLSDGRVVALEVDGPTHFLCNSPHKYGPTVLRDRQLARVLGQRNMVSVPYWEWDALHGQKAAEEQYVWGLMVGGEGASGVEAQGGGASGHDLTQRGFGRVAEPREGEGRTAPEVVAQASGAGAATGAAAPAGALGTAEGEAGKRRRRRRQAGEQEGEQQGLQLEREPPAAAACALAGGAAGGAVAEGSKGAPGATDRQAERRRGRSAEEGPGAAGGTARQGEQPLQAPPVDGATHRVRAPRRRRQKVQDLAQAP